MKKLILVLAAFLSFNTSYAKETTQKIDLKVTEDGFQPSEIKVKPDTHVILKVTRVTDQTCAKQIKINGQKTGLPLNKQVTVDAGTLQKGEIRFACGMDMVTGHIVAE